MTEKIKIKLDFMQGPIWLTDQETGEPETGIDRIDNDSKLKDLCKKAIDINATFYEFNSHNQPCWFNEEKERESAEIILSLVKQIKDRLFELNDGSFSVEDYETKRLLSIKKK